MAFLPPVGAKTHSEAGKGVGTQIGQARSSVDRGSRDTSRPNEGRFATSAQRAAENGGPITETARAVVAATRWVTSFKGR